MMPMRDGVRLHTVFYFPDNMPDKAPVVLVRSPYCRRTYFELPHAEALKRKCVFIMQSVRGTAFSEGLFQPFLEDIEKNDAEDLLTYLEQQPWFNGNCVMFGGSFPGYLQWSAARSGNSCLKAIAPKVAPLYGCCTAARPGGGIALGFIGSWLLSMHYRCKWGYENLPDLNGKRLWNTLPINEYDRKIYDCTIDNFQEFLASARCPEKALTRHKAWFKNIHTPAFISGGWFDYFKQESIESFKLMKQDAATASARQITRLTMGPWGHGGLLNPELFGAENNYDTLRKRETKFLFGMIDDPETDPLPEDPVVTYFMLGENCWYGSGQWPPQGGVDTPFYLHSNGNANSCRGDGSLDNIPPQNEVADCFVSDPRQPVTTSGSLHGSFGCSNRALVCQRQDVLVYDSAIFETDFTIAGRVKLQFFASISTVDTDFCASLSDVAPDGRCLAFTSGMLRARFAETMAEENFVSPGTVKRYEIDLGDTAIKFKAGHRMRLDICGQNFPVYDRNANSGKSGFGDTELFESRITIFHDAEHPAVLILPVNDSCVPLAEVTAE